MINFKKCDFHIHSPFSDGGVDCKIGSALNENLDNFSEKLIEKAKELNFDALAITDHDAISKYLFNKLNDQNDIKIFVGFEKKFTFSDKIVEEYNLTIKKSSFDSIVIIDENKIDAAIELLDTYKDGSGNYEPVDFEKFVNDFREIKFYFIPHSGNKSNSIDETLPNKTEDNQKFKRRLITNNFNNFALDTNKGDISGILQRDFGIDAPVFSFSDSHSIEEHKPYNEFGKLYTWINFDLTFDDLIMAFTDAASRIVPSYTDELVKNPQENLNSYISEIKLGESEDELLKLTPGYNSIIGIRGSGKSKLLNSFREDPHNLINKHSNVYFKVSDRPYSNSHNLRTLAIHQDYLSKIFDAENSVENVEFIDNLKQKNREKVETAKEISKRLISDFIKRLYNLITSEYPAELTWINILFDINNEVPFDFLEKPFKNVYAETINNENKNLMRIHEIFNLVKGIKDQNTYNSSIKEFIDFQEYVSKIVEEFDSKKDYLLIHSNFSAETKKFIYENKSRSTLIDLINDSINQFNKDSKNDSVIYNNSINYLINVLSLNFEINNLVEYYSSEFKKIVDGLRDIEDDETFDINGDKYYFSNRIIDNNDIDKIFNMDNGIFNAKGSFKEFIRHYYIYGDIRYDGLDTRKTNNIYTISEVLQKIKDELLKEVNKYLAIDFDLGIIENNKRTSYKDMSPGTISNLVWQIIIERELKNNIDLLLIDQPEDNLDMLTIKNSIVRNLRKLSRTMQIIIVSHNAAVIINGDSDNVLMAENSNGLFTYKKVKTYNSENEIINILDGGTEYFKKRFGKYNSWGET